MDRQNTAMQSHAPSQGSPLAVGVNLVTVYLIWGSTYLAIRVMVETVPPFLGAGSRYLVAGALMLAFLWIRSRVSRSPAGRLERVTWREWRSSAIVGGLLLLGGNGFVVLSEQRIDSGIAAVIVAAVPIWMNLFDAVLRRRRPSALAIGGVAAGFLGVLVLLAPVGGVSAADPAGIGMVIFASLSWAIGSLYSRHAPMPRSGLLATGMEMLCGGVLLAIAATVTGEVGRIDLGTYSSASLLAIGYLVVFGSLVAFSSYTWLLKSAPISTVATYAYVNPIVAVALGALLLGETLEPRTLVAALLIIGAVVAMVSGRPREPEQGAPPEGVLEPIPGEGEGEPDAGADIGPG
jgi:drug/metabolite transporter (DMT)-like permease